MSRKAQLMAEGKCVRNVPIGGNSVAFHYCGREAKENGVCGVHIGADKRQATLAARRKEKAAQNAIATHDAYEARKAARIAEQRFAAESSNLALFLFEKTGLSWSPGYSSEAGWVALDLEDAMKLLKGFAYLDANDDLRVSMHDLIEVGNR